MSIPASLLPNYTHEDYAIWEGDWELIEGLPYAMAPKPMRKHQSIEAAIVRYLHEAFEACEECEVLAEVDWKISDKTVVAPDVVVTCGDDEEEAYLVKPPKIIFEILSNSSAQRDRVLKFELYQENGVPTYILVDPDKMDYEVYLLKNGKYERDFGAGPRLRFELPKCEAELDFDKVFAGVKSKK